jgi:ECF transporter S component (folate family)
MQGIGKSVIGRFFMQKSRNNKLKQLVLAGVFAAISIVLGKLFAFNIGELFRVSFENLPIIFAGIALGPLFGAAVGLVADITGCLIVGYSINPVITAGAVSIGFLSGLVFRLGTSKALKIRVLLSVFGAHIVGSVIIKTAGLAWFYGTDFWTLIFYRAINYALIIALEHTIIYILARNKEISSQIKMLGNVEI